MQNLNELILCFPKKILVEATYKAPGSQRGYIYFYLPHTAPDYF